MKIVLKIILLIGAILILLVLLLLLVWYLRVRNFKPTEDKILQAEQLNADLEPAGFAYSLKGDYFYSLMNCWQRETGYCKLYDENAALFDMAMDCEPIEFSYAGKRWLIELWKGQYGITTGAEIGVYNTSKEDVKTEKFTGTFYENISDAERLPLSFVLKRGRSVLLRRRALHWWLTAFKLGEFSEVKELTMKAKIKFPDILMRNAFVNALRELGYTEGEYTVFRNAVKVEYTKPHSKQPESQQGASRALVQQTNKNNCKLYQFATSPYSDTLDKLEYLKTAMPNLYQLFLKSLYSKAFYEGFKWLLDLIFGKHPTPPEPPCPPKPPCPPEPPCPPDPPKPPCPPEPPCPPTPHKPPCPPDPHCHQEHQEKHCSDMLECLLEESGWLDDKENCRDKKDDKDCGEDFRGDCHSC